MGNDTQPDDLTIPSFLKRDSDNRAEFSMSEEVVTEVESRPAKPKIKAKANGHDKALVKAAGKPKAKVAAKAPVKAKTAPKATAKPAKATVKAKAPKAKAESKVEKDAYGLRKGSAKSKAAALFARKSGATLPEIKEAVGSVQLNVLVGLEAEGYEVIKKKETRNEGRPLTRYYLKGKA